MGEGEERVGAGRCGEPQPAREQAMGLVRRMGRELLEEGTYASITEGAIPYPEANRLFSGE